MSVDLKQLSALTPQSKNASSTLKLRFCQNWSSNKIYFKWKRLVDVLDDSGIQIFILYPSKL